MATKNWVLKRILTPTADDLGRKFSRLFPLVDTYQSFVREDSAPIEVQPLIVYILSLDRKVNHFVVVSLKKKLMNEEAWKKKFPFLGGTSVP